LPGMTVPRKYILIPAICRGIEALLRPRVNAENRPNFHS
jgi:hypothetical protein